MQRLCGELNIIPLALTADAKRGGAFHLTGDPYRMETPTDPPEELSYFGGANTPRAAQRGDRGGSGSGGGDGGGGGGGGGGGVGGGGGGVGGGGGGGGSDIHRVALVLHTSVGRCSLSVQFPALTLKSAYDFST
jgi:hypothetical protein